MAIGEIITGNDIKMIQLSNQRITYVAPTVYRLSNGVSSWNYYATAEDAIKQYNFLMDKPGYKKVAPKGSVSFKTQSAATFGINVDFFLFTGGMGVFPSTFEVVKNLLYTQKKYYLVLVRFFKSDGAGPFFAVLDRRYFGISAISLNNVEPAKAAALNDYHKQVQLLKAKYNSLAAFVLELSKKKLNNTEQQVFNESIVMLMNFKDQLKDLKGVDIRWTNTGQIGNTERIGIVPIIWIAIIVVTAVTAAYSVDKILAYLKDAKQVDGANDVIKFMEDQKLKIAIARDSKQITSSTADSLMQSATDAQQNAQKLVTDLATKKDSDIFDKITNILLLGGGIFLISKLAKNG